MKVLDSHVKTPAALYTLGPILILLLTSGIVFGQYPIGSPVAINGKLKVYGT